MFDVNSLTETVSIPVALLPEYEAYLECTEKLSVGAGVSFKLKDNTIFSGKIICAENNQSGWVYRIRMYMQGKDIEYCDEPT